MLKELIEEEKKKSSSRIQRRQLLDEKKKETEDRIKLLEGMIAKCEEELKDFNAYYPTPFVEQKFNFFQRLLKTNKYTRYLREKKRYDENYTSFKESTESLSEYKKESTELRDELVRIDIELKSIDENKDDEALQKMQKEDTAVEVILKRNPELSKNPDFMREIVAIDVRNLRYDQTDSPEIFIQAMESLIKSYESVNSEGNGISKREKDWFDRSLEEYRRIANSQDTVPGKYRIPIKFLNETIKREMSVQENPIHAFINPIESYNIQNNKFPQEYGKKIEELWEDKSIRLGFHGFKGIIKQDDERKKSLVQDVFKNGLRTSQQQIGTTDLQYAVVVQDEEPTMNFFRALDYDYQHGGYILMAIPEECFGTKPQKPIWGGDSPRATGNEFVLPQYVVGYVSQDSELMSDEYFNSRHIEYNTQENLKKYSHFFKNGTNGEKFDVENVR